MPFPDTVRALPRTELSGAPVYVHDDGRTQVLFIEVPPGRPAVVVPTHTHGLEWGFVSEGAIEMTIDGRVELHRAGETHVIPAQIPHSFRIEPGTCSVHFFAERRVSFPPRS
ncbi:MAG TPA: cupin domain-containing protein [Thermoplasmata archaeon]|nr:cupin domain-containing protein [Thermoplasmata archaeon]